MDAFEYDASANDELGYFSPSQHKVYLGPKAATVTYEFTVSNSNNEQEKYVIGLIAVGIDACAAVCAHEAKHMENYDSLLRYNYKDRDGDGVPDDVEINSQYHLDPDKPDTYNIAAKFIGTPFYQQFQETGDNEFLAFMAERNSRPQIDASVDWSVNGKNWRR